MLVHGPRDAVHAGQGPARDASEHDDRGNLRCPEKPIAALVVHGVDDPEVKVPGAQKTREHWRRVSACRTGPGVARDPAPCVDLAACASDRPVAYCEVPALGHALWSDGPKVTWAFFDSF